MPQKTTPEKIFAVVKIGASQFKVTEGDEFLVDHQLDKKLSIKPYLVVDGETTLVGDPEVKDYSCEIEIIESEVKGDKKMTFRYKPKTGYHRKKGPRALYSRIKVVKIKKTK
jgi:large subunit ribosomal protein L21